MKKRYFAAALLLATVYQVSVAQSGTNSPYSQFGLGILSDQTSGFNRGMNGLGLGFREHNQVNYLNPASYSSIDSLSFIFDAGISGQITNFKEGGTKLNAKNSNIEYVVAGFRAFRHVGVSFGIIPYTNTGYSYSTSQNVNDANNTVVTNTYNGSGGLHQIYVGVGWEPVKGLSVGVNGGYLFGGYTRTVVNSYSDSYANTLTKEYTSDVRNYKVDFGMQYVATINKKHQVTIGATYGMGHKIGGDPTLKLISNNTQTAVADTTVLTSDALKLEIPTTIGVGLAYNYNNKLKVGVDYNFQKWGSIETPEYKLDTNGNATYDMVSGFYKDRHKLTAGADYCAAEYGRSFVKRIHYRAGVSYATPYYIINGQDGPKEISASLGFGIPIVNSWNNRSMLNISAQWVRQTAKSYITENTFRINIGLTFNERWFAKWKVD
ncbi:MAG: hypothetical protein KAZ98_02275 [Prevotella sp.]|nr:hypothetical protein [Prevotella sp.]